MSSVEAAPDPQRLLGSSSPFETRLLGAAERDAMPFRSRRRILSGLGLAGLFSTSAIASAVKASGLAGGLKLGAGASALAVGAAMVVAGTSLLPTPEPPPAPLTRSAPVAAVEEKTASPAIAPALAEPVEVPAVPKAAPRAVAPVDSLSAELAALEDARRALRGGDPASSIRKLDAYSRRFPRPKLRTEATVLRIEALAQGGEREAAAKLAETFLSRYADSPYSRRVRSLAGASEP
jgi:hypothetical protein